MENPTRMASFHVAAAAVLLNLGLQAACGQQLPAAPPAPSVNQQALPDAPSAPSEPRPTPAADAPGQFSSSEPEVPRPHIDPGPNGEITVLEDTLIRVRTDQPVSSRYSKDGQPVTFTLDEDVTVNDAVVIPRGATVHGEILGVKKSGVLTGTPELTLELVSLDLGGKSYALHTYQFRVEGATKTKPTEAKVKGGAVVGALVGGVFAGSAKGVTTATGKLAGAGAGAAVGAGLGALTSAATPGPSLTLPAESQMDFYLASPISVLPVSAAEAARVARRVRPGDPVLYVRGETP